MLSCHPGVRGWMLHQAQHAEGHICETLGFVLAEWVSCTETAHFDFFISVASTEALAEIFCSSDFLRYPHNGAVSHQQSGPWALVEPVIVLGHGPSCSRRPTD
jgi:hypothetical protein